MAKRAVAFADPDWAKLPDGVRDAWFNLLAVHQRVVRHLDETLADEFGLRLPEWDALVRLAYCAEGYCMGDLSKKVDLTPSGMTRMMDRLEKRGLVERRRGQEDGRETRTAITRAGRDLIAKAAPRHSEELRRHLQGPLTAREAEQLAALLGKVATGASQCSGFE